MCGNAYSFHARLAVTGKRIRIKSRYVRRAEQKSIFILAFAKTWAGRDLRIKVAQDHIRAEAISKDSGLDSNGQLIVADLNAGLV